MKKTFRAWQVDQSLLLRPSVHDFVPADHPAHFIRELEREDLDLSAIVESYDAARGYPPYDPWMMTALLLYGYIRGVYSSRRLARACEERLDFMAVTALNKPDFRTVSEFRRRHSAALSGLFEQVLKLCRKAGLVRLGHVAPDGTKVKTNASKHRAMSYERMSKAEPELIAEIAKWFEAAEAADSAEDTAFGVDQRGDELPAWVADKQKRLAKVREAKAALDAEAKAEAEEKAKQPKKYRGGRKPKTLPGEPEAGAQRNFTDPESRIMKAKDGFIQGYNAQAGVDAADQVIVAQGLTENAADSSHLVPLVEAIEASTGGKPREVSADVGYCSEANLKALEERGVRGYIATGRQKHPASGEQQRRAPLVEAMRQRLKRGGRRSRYRLRKQIVEPVFGQIKEARGFRRFLMRGKDKVAVEWALLCAVHDILQLHKAT